MRPSRLPRLEGSERFAGLDASVRDFWAWALGDLRMNNARGHLAEFLVARATSARETVREEWGAHDVTTAEGVRLEVKSSAYLQSWTQTKPSSPRFSLTGAKEIWDAQAGTSITPTGSRVDAWVFCLHTCQAADSYDPLMIGQWEFWVASNSHVQSLRQRSAGLTTIKREFGVGAPWAQIPTLVARSVGTGLND